MLITRRRLGRDRKKKQNKKTKKKNAVCSGEIINHAKGAEPVARAQRRPNSVHRASFVPRRSLRATAGKDYIEKSKKEKKKTRGEKAFECYSLAALLSSQGSDEKRRRRRRRGGQSRAKTLVFTVFCLALVRRERLKKNSEEKEKEPNTADDTEATTWGKRKNKARVSDLISANLIGRLIKKKH